MEIRQYIIKKVANYGGLDKYQADLKALAPEFGEKIHHLNETAVLFNLIHQNIPLDLDKIARENELRILQGLSIFKAIHKKTGSEFTRLNIEMIENHLMAIPGRHLRKVV